MRPELYEFSEKEILSQKEKLRVAEGSVLINASGPHVGFREITRQRKATLNRSSRLYTKNSGTLYSYGNNSANANATNGAFTGTVGLQ
jgi:hypothetical protein